MATSKDKVILGKIGAAHGVRGEVRVKTFTADPLGLSQYGPLMISESQALEITHIREAKTVVIVRFKGLESRDEVEALKGRQLYIHREALPEPDEESSEFYYSDLIGLEIKASHGAVLGKVSAVYDYGAGDLLELHLKDGRKIPIPFTHDFVPVVNVNEGYVIIDPPEGLIEDLAAPKPRKNKEKDAS